MTLNYDHNNYNSPTINHDTTKIMLSAIFSLTFVIILVIILHIYVRCALRSPPRRRSTTFSAAFIYSHQVRDVEPTPIKSGLDPIVINSLPSFLINQSDEAHDKNEECTICLGMLQNNELARRLPNCNHIFHVECIDTWLMSQSTCPICRSDATPRLNPLDREPPRVVDVEHVDSDHPSMASSSGKIISNGSGPSSFRLSSSGKVISNESGPSSFRLSSFRKMIGRDRSSSSSRRNTQVNVEIDLERQGQQ
ncbi:E3 ubiquitin-protein ligase ATL41-like [Silene latifolia]|uniref:E3 ubiquitin-protein ligase ATL41-like n=1 Tax=Silene latifolia TaxID=37657 RepID=UPI003D78AC2F